MSDENDWFERALEESADRTDRETDDGDWFDGTESGAETAEGDPDEDTLFEDDFATAFAEAGGPEDPAAEMGVPSETGPEEFADEDLDSELPRVDLGVEGLDSMIQGGIPARSLMVAIGSAGTGKSTLGMQFLHHGLSEGQRCVFIALEESYEAVVATADEKGWNFSGAADRGDLAIVDLDPVEMANSLESIRDELPDLVEAFDAKRLVLDSVSLLEMMYDDLAQRRTEIYDFTQGLEEAGVTTLLTSEADQSSAYSSRYGIIEYLTDAVFVLQYIRGDDFRETRLAVEIVKIRNANHSREAKPYEITDNGLKVYRQANIF